jgi:hypothetical protein
MGTILRTLIEKITLTPEGSELAIHLRGDLAGILSTATVLKMAQNDVSMRPGPPDIRAGSLAS